MAKKKKESNRDELTGIIADSLNKKFNKTHHRVAYFLDGSEDSPTDVSDWVSTGSTVLDLAISNCPNGGFPVSKIVEIIDEALDSLMPLFWKNDSYNLYSLPNSVLTKYFFKSLDAGDFFPERVSAVILLTSNSNNKPVFRYLECLIFILGFFYKYMKISSP